MAVGGDLALNVAASLIFEGLKRPFQALQFEMKRRTAVSKALQEKPTARSVKAEAQISEAIEALARVIGNSEGKLDQNTALFIREVQRTAIPETIFHLALCGRDPEPVFPSFSAIYDLFSGLPFSSKALFNALHASILERVEKVEDGALLEILRAQNHALSTQLDQVIASLNNASHVKGINTSSIEDARVKVAKSIEAANRFVNIETLQGSKKFKLKSLSIPARLGELDELAIQSARASDQDFHSIYINFRRQTHRAVILGDPGGGKSTLTQLLAIDLSSAITLEAANPGEAHIDVRDLRLPLRIVLRSYESRKEKNPAYSFFDHIRDEILIALEQNVEFAAKFLQRTLSLGEAVVIFDGLDEVLDIDARRTMVTYIEQFAEIYSACPIMVTSRLVGYRDAPLSEDFTPYGLAQFNDAEVLKYAENAIRAVNGLKVAEAKQKAEAFLKQTESVGGDLRKNPLMLGLMVQIFVFRGDVPSNRPEIYKECAMLMFEKWDGRRNIVANVPYEDFELLDVFSFVAGRIFGSPEREEGVSRDWLTKELKVNFENWYIDKANAFKAAKALVEFLTGRAWVMSEVGHHTYKFTHRTFLEYFFARGLISECRDIEELIREKLLERVARNEWNVIAHLSLQMAVFREGGKMRQAATVIQSILEDTPLPSKQELAVLTFVSRATEYLTLPEVSYSHIAKLVVDRAIRVGSKEDTSASSVVRALLSAARTRASLALSALDAEVGRWAAQPDAFENIFCMYLLDLPAATGRSPRSIDNVKRRSRLDRAWASLQSIRVKYREQFLQSALKSPIAARSYIYLYNERRLQLYNIHGINLLISAQSPLVPGPAERTLPEALLVGLAGLTRDLDLDGPESGIDDRIRFIRSVADDALAGAFTSLSAPLISREYMREFKGDLEEVVRRMWHFRRSPRRYKRSEASLGAIMVCVCLLLEHFPHFRDERGDLGIKRSSRRKEANHMFEILAPTGIFRELLSSMEGSDFAPILRAWIDDEFRFSGTAPR